MAKEVDRTGMRPRLGQTHMVLPITFDYSGGRKDSKRMSKIWSVILAVVGLIIGIGAMFSKKGLFLFNIIVGLAIIYAFVFVIRFFLLKEGPIRQTEIMLTDSDFKRDYKDFWGIYNVEEQYPYYCRFRTGKTGVFIKLNKDVILGKYSEAEFEHYEAIGDAYNICGSSNITMCHLDYMDFVGTDERIENSFATLDRVQNPDLKDLLTDIYTYQQKQMLERVTTFDVYLFMWSGNDFTAMNTIKRLLSCFMQANYRSYHILHEQDLRELTKVLMNLKDFSILEASTNAFVTQQVTGIVPIKILHEDGSEEELGKTSEEIRRERELKAKEEELRKEEIKKRKKEKYRNKNEVLEEDEEIDLFD